MTPDAQTLTQRLEAGRIPLLDTLRYALQIVDTLRHAHEEGHCHGALTPDVLILGRSSVELVAAQSGAAQAVTPYTAPERLQGPAADVRTDIFSFGAILYEMLTGRRAFEGSDTAALTDAIENSMPPPIGDTGLDRLVLNCLVKDPAGRWQRVQQLHMELKILSFSANRARAAAVPAPPNPALLAELRQLDASLTARLEHHEQAIAGVRDAASTLPSMESRWNARLEQHSGESMAGLQRLAAELPLLESHLASYLEQHRSETAADLDRLAGELPRLESRLGSQLEQHEQAIAGLHQTTGELPRLESRLTTRLEQHEQTMASLGVRADEVPQLESRLETRLEQQDQALAAVERQHEQTAAALPALESRLASRLDQHDQAVSALQQHEQAAAAALPALESRLTSHIQQHDQTAGGLRNLAAEHSSLLQSATQQLDTVQQRLVSLESQIAGSREQAEQTARQVVEEGRSAAASLHMSLAEELQTIALTVKEQAAAIQSIRGAMARTDDFMERVVEALESLQTMVLEQTRP